MALQTLFQKHEISTEDVVWKVTISRHCCYFTDVNQSSKLLLSNGLKLSPGFGRWGLNNAELCPEANRTVKKYIQV